MTIQEIRVLQGAAQTPRRDLELEILTRQANALERFGGAATLAAGAANFLGLSTEEFYVYDGNLNVGLKKAQLHSDF